MMLLIYGLLDVALGAIMIITGFSLLGTEHLSMIIALIGVLFLKFGLRELWEVFAKEDSE